LKWQTACRRTCISRIFKGTQKSGGRNHICAPRYIARPAFTRKNIDISRTLTNAFTCVFLLRYPAISKIWRRMQNKWRQEARWLRSKKESTTSSMASRANRREEKKCALYIRCSATTVCVHSNNKQSRKLASVFTKKRAT